MADEQEDTPASTTLTKPPGALAAPSQQPRIAVGAIRASTFEVDLAPAFPSSSHDTNDSRPLPPEQVGASASEVIARSEQDNFQQFPVIEADLGAHHGSYSRPGHAMSILNQSSDPSTVHVDAPRKYRLNRSSRSRDLHLPNVHHEPSLSEILEQERDAWLAQSSTNLDTSVPCYPHHGQSHQSTASTSRLKHKSCFQEGSMNETSKGIASTWLTAQPDCTQNHDNDLRSVESSDADGTPRASIASRASTYSSIDINEFKPLPATPSTFKTTIKRLGRRVVNSKSADTVEPPMVSSKPVAKAKKRLRKSMSTWKIFGNSLSDCEEDANLSTDNESSTSKTAKTPKTVTKARLDRDVASSYKFVLDERKRKAEIAYSQQFGTARKRSKYFDLRDHQYNDLSDKCDLGHVPTVRQRDFPQIPTSRTERSTFRDPIDDSLVSPVFQTSPVDLCIPSPSSKLPTFLRHNRSQSHEPTQGTVSKTDHAKKRSRSELEKENQRLRLMLRSKEATPPIREHPGHSCDFLDTRILPSDKQSATTEMIENSDSRGHQELTTSMQPVVGEFEPSRQDVGSDSPSLHLRTPATLQILDTGSRELMDIPPVPRLRETMHHNGALSLISGNTQHVRESATIKHRTPNLHRARQIELPRPLSMVLELVESGNDEDIENGRSDVHLDGTACEENNCHDAHAIQVETGHQHAAASRQWTWPDDVF